MADDTDRESTVAEQEKAQWQKTSGFAADSTRFQIVVSEDRAEQWKQDAKENGYHSRNKYLLDLIREGEAARDRRFLSRHRLEAENEKLQEELAHLQSRLHQQEKRRGGRLEFDDTPFLKRFLTPQYRSLPDLLRDIMESGALNEMLRKRVEDELYVLAQQGEVQYRRGWGWKLANGGER